MDDLMNLMIVAACKSCGVLEENLTCEDRLYLEEVFSLIQAMATKRLARHGVQQ